MNIFFTVCVVCIFLIGGVLGHGRSLQLVVQEDYESFDSCDEAFGTRLTPGIWTSRGFGFAIQVNGDQTCTIFQETDVSCIQDGTCWILRVPQI